MNSATIIFVYICLSYLHSETLAQENILTKCGQTLLADEGVIEYKLNQTYDAGELCTFIIKLERFAGATFTLESHNFSFHGQDSVAVIPVHTGEPLFSYIFGPFSATRVIFEESVFVVVFKTTTNNGTGFRLSFVHGIWPSQAIPGPPMVFNDDSSVPLNFPFPNDFMLSYHPIALTSGAKIVGENSTLELTIWENFWVSENCGSYFDIHTYDGGENEYLGRLCGREVEEKIYRTQGIFIVVFVSNNAIDMEPPQGTLSWKTVNETGAML